MANELSPEEQEKITQSRARSDAQLFEGGVDVVRDPDTDNPRLHLTDDQMERMGGLNALHSVELPPENLDEAERNILRCRSERDELLLQIRQALRTLPKDPAQKQRLDRVQQLIDTVQKDVEAEDKKAVQLHVLMGEKKILEIKHRYIIALQKEIADLKSIRETLGA